MRTSHLSLAALALVASSAGAAFVSCGDTSASESANLSVSSIVFVKRQHTTVTGEGVRVDVAGGNGQVLDYTRYVPGGSLVLLSPARADGTLENVTAAFPEADFNGVDVSFDGSEIVFSMKRDPQDHYHLYTAKLAKTAAGAFDVHQKTGGDHDDINPIYIAGGRIAFATNQMYTAMGTRADEYNHGRAVTQLATISVEGGDADRRLASQNLSHTVSPFLRSDGKVGYCRWEHLGAVNDVKLFAANPDGTQMVAVAGQHGKPSNSLFTPREISPNVYVAIATARERTIHAGALVRIDARNHDDPTCLDPVADQTGHACVDEERATYEVLTPDVPTGMQASPVGRYRDPSVLPDGRLLVSYAEGTVNDQNELAVTPPDFGIYVFDPISKKNQLVYNDRETWDLDAVAVAPHREPPVIGDLVGASVDPETPVRIGSVDVTRTSLGAETVDGAQFVGTPLDQALRQAVKVRVIEGFSSEAAKGVTMFGLTMDEGAAILGEATVHPDGSWLAEIPPYVPVHLQPIDKFGMSIRNQRLWIQGMPGEDRRCVGCHEGRTSVGAPRAGQNPTVAEQRGADRFLAAIADRLEISWAAAPGGPTGPQEPVPAPARTVQQILDAKCVSCHSGGAGDPFAGRSYTLQTTNPGTGQTTPYVIPYLDLSSRLLTVTYDRQTAAYPASYVTVFYPAALRMEMSMGVQATGEIPPEWAIPNDARRSKLVEKLNVRAADGTFAWGTGTLHPEDKGTTLTDEERQTLVRAIDVGGQFWTRQNTGFVPFANDPIAGRRY